MHLNWKNAFSGLSVAFFMAAASLHAIPLDPCNPRPEVICCENPKPGPFAFSYPFDMDLNCPADFYLYGDFLAMQAKQDGMEFAIQKSNGHTLTGTQTSLTNGTFEGFSDKNHDWPYNFGLRLGLGVYLNHDAWDLDFSWMGVRVSDHKKANTSTAGAVLVPLFALGEDTDPQLLGQRSAAKWKAAYNTFDITLGKPYYVSRYFIVNPHFGIRGASINQYFSVDYSGLVGQNATGFRFVHRSHNEFWGLGARAGIDTDWVVGNGFSLFGNMATAMLFGKFDTTQHLTTPVTTVHTQNIGFDINNNYYMNVPNFEIALGIGWGQHFNQQRYHVSLRGAYEFHIWYDQLNIRKFFGVGQTPSGLTQVPNYPNDAVSRGNFTLNGFSLALRFDM